LPQQQIEDLTLPLSGTVKPILADGSEVTSKRYVCLIAWFGEEREPFRMKMASEFRAREWDFLSAPIPLPQIRLPTFFSVVAIPGMR